MKIRSLVICAALAVASIVASGAEARLVQADGPNYPQADRLVTPLSCCLATPVALPWGDSWDVCGLQAGILYNDVSHMTGLQIGLFNVTDFCCGVQFGLVNVTRRMQGVQLGLVNVIQDSDIACLPIVNAYF